VLTLPTVTLVCADTRNHALAARALARCCRRVRFARALFLTDAVPAGVVLPPEVEVRPIATLSSRDDYSNLMLKGLATHVETAHALVVQWDGYVLHPESWTDEFLAFDYLGAPWPWQPENRRVGNGGFSLRSKRLLEALADPAIAVEGNEDVAIGVTHRAHLENAHGIRYAPEALANRFSFEVSYPIGRPFGFHGLFNFARVESADEIVALAPRFSDDIARSLQMFSLMRNCAAMNQRRAAHALAARLLDVAPQHAEALRIRDEAARASARRPAEGRNDPCPCGSGKRFKACHGAIASAAPTIAPASPGTAAAGAGDPDALTSSGMEAHRSGKLDDAERAYRAALASAPDHPHAGHYLGVIEMQRGEYPSAIARLERAAAARPDVPDFPMNLGLAYAGADRFGDAIAAYRRSIAIDPRRAAPWNNLGLALMGTADYDEAAAAFRRAIDIDATIPKVRWNLAMARLMLGDRDGWSDYESRLAIEELGAGGDLADIPRYHGGDVDGMTLLVEPEQGYGDILQFARFVAVLARRGAKVILRLPDPIANLMRSVPGVADVVPLDARPPVDAWLPLMSVPGALGVHPHGEAPDPPYVFADPARVESMRALLARHPAKAHVGLAWAGNPKQGNNRRRSCPLSALAPLLERGDVAWYSLQRGDGEDQIATVPAARSLRLVPARNNFDDKAALVNALDLVVSVCTSNAHLAGALGRPVWIMLAHAPDWRWGPSGSTSAWYPTARLFRQPAQGDWAGVVRDVGAALDAWMASR